MNSILAEHMYGGEVRYFLNPSSETERQEIDRILKMAKTAPPSPALSRGMLQQGRTKPKRNCPKKPESVSIR